jgi:hypothetical protein
LSRPLNSPIMRFSQLLRDKNRANMNQHGCSVKA